MIVEDEPLLAEMMHDLLEPLYSEVVLRASADEAQEEIKKRSFSVVLTDIMMPGMHGHEFVAFLRSLGHIEPVIFVTGNATREVLLSAVRLGVSDVIEKPFDGADLLHAIEQTLEIDKRRVALYESVLVSRASASSVQGQKKMIGLLHASREANKNNRK